MTEFATCRVGANGMASVRLRFGVDPRTPEANLLLAPLVLGSSSGVPLALRTLGAEANARVDLDDLTVAITAPVEALDAALSAVADALDSLRADGRAVRAEAGRQAALLDLARTDAGMVADETANALIYGPAHPYGRAPDAGLLAGLSHAEVAGALGRAVSSSSRLGVAVGDAEPAMLTARLETFFAVLDGRAEVPPAERSPAVPPAPPFPAARTHVEHASPAAETRVIFPAPALRHRVGLASAAADQLDPPGQDGRGDSHELAAMEVCAALLGGSSSSLLFRQRRERSGLTYGSSARIVHAVAGSAMIVSSSCAPAHVERVISETLHSVRTLPQAIDDGMVRSRAAQLAGARRIRLATPAGLADSMLAGGPALRLDRVTADDVRRVTARYLAETTRVIVSVAPPSDVSPM
ncbi:hypothetical protein ALI44B_12020 [Leifsonia sp. ALI-44-B]|uniref:M16 family metallopeptidase n=1 Tax=Leifsonia sp. ALI-44-B TaxID=1933776 RepID=UPI00097BAEFB|nr:insulinase family protein [Leifsonia sp. ALI-44-B]ONI61199.1 hypothetical protein ALI44B_12020 [Leifsonia sp. ALI-44-B]